MRSSIPVDEKEWSADEKDWFAAVGVLAIYWADMETMLDVYIHIMLLHPSIFDPKQPSQSLEISFNKRIRLWKDTVVRLPFGKKRIQHSLDLADRARTARNHRDLLLHGATYKAPDGRFMAHHWPKKQDQEVQRLHYPAERVMGIAKEIRNVHIDILGSIAKISGELARRYARKSGKPVRPRGSYPTPATPDKP
jgi:hypothetical protein